MSRADPVQDPRIAKKEMIVTRFKSAQQKKQMTDKQPSNKPPQTTKPQTVTKSQQTATKFPIKITKLPIKVAKLQETTTKLPQTAKSPLPKTKSSKRAKTQKSPNKSKDNVPEAKSPILIEDDNPEYYPDKLKRALGTRKVFLKPKQKSTTIARTNKRKFNTPKRGIKSPLPNQSTCSTDSESVPNCQSPAYSELSMAEVIRMVEENDSLDDEDLMEILTCPSPVWWEEPPDEMYIEEAICSREPNENSAKKKSPIRERCFNTLKSAKLGNKIKTQVSNPDTTINDVNNEITEIKKDDKFMKKSKKLENVLGNIKNNKACKDNDLVNKRIKQEKLDASLQSEIGKKSTDKAGIPDSDAVVETNEDTAINDKDKAEESTVTDIKRGNEENMRKTKKLSVSTEDSFADLSCRSQELWLDLENMNIPIEDNLDMNSPDCVIINDDNSNKVIDLDALDNKLDTDNEDLETVNIDAKDSSNTHTESKSDRNLSNNTIEQESRKRIPEMANNVDDEQTLVPKNMPPLIKCPKFENILLPSPNSYKSISDEITESSSISGIDLMDTISDTNIKFITDDDIDDVSDSDNKNKDNDEAVGDENKVDDEKHESNRNSLVKDDHNNSELNEPAAITNANESKSKDTYITVYKIVPNDEGNQKQKNKFKNIPEYSSYVENLIQSETKTDSADDSLDNEIPDVPDTKGQLISFFKKCKNANRKRKRIDVHDKIENETNDPACPSPKISITVAQDENVKYCMKCSSIFDTEDCSYCLKTQKEPDRSLPEKSFTCDKCDFVGDTTNNVNVHLKKDHIEDVKSP